MSGLAWREDSYDAAVGDDPEGAQFTLPIAAEGDRERGAEALIGEDE